MFRLQCVNYEPISVSDEVLRTLYVLINEERYIRLSNVKPHAKQACNVRESARSFTDVCTKCNTSFGTT